MAKSSESASAGHAEHIQFAENMGILDAVQRPLNVVFLGAGSGFFRPLFIDVLSIPGADRGVMSIVDIDETRLGLAEKLGKKILAEMGKTGWTLKATTDRRKVLKGAQYIINCIEVSGTKCVRHDNGIPLKYGVDQCIGDTLGPGGLFKALRTVPVFLKVLADVEELCPEAWVLNYTNPMSIMCLSAYRGSKAKVVGLCHSVQGTSHLMAEVAQVPYPEMRWKCGGINHMAWMVELTREGKDLYPIIFERSRKVKEVYEKSPIRFDIMYHFGAFVTESGGHFSEYVPYYRKRKDLLKKYTRKAYTGESGFYARMWPASRKNNDAARRDILAGKQQITYKRTWEYASYIIQAMETNSPLVIYGSMPNHGLIDNLPQDGVVEVACLVDRRGVTPTHFGRLPKQLAALCDWDMRMIDLAADACVQKSRDLAAHALMLDPLTAAVCCPAEIKKMTEELFRAEKEFLPGF